MRDMTVGRLVALLKEHNEDAEICMTSRMDYGTHITAINYVGLDKHGNLVITFSDNLLKKL